MTAQLAIQVLLLLESCLNSPEWILGILVPKCEPCYSSSSSPFSCATCSDGANSSCLSCNPNTFLYPNTGGQCLDSCSAGFWKDNSSNTCQPCYSSSSDPYFTCATCSRGSNNDCLSCSTGTFLYPSTGGQCVDNCPVGYCEDTSSNACQICSSPKTDPYTGSGLKLPTTATVLSTVASTLPAALSTSVSAFQPANSLSGKFVNLFLCVSAFDSIANMQYLNINHSKIALGVYSGLSGSIYPNWIAKYNRLNSKMLYFEYGAFEQNNLSSLYLDNYGDSITGLMAHFTIFLLLGLFSLTKTKEELMSCRAGKFYITFFGLTLSTICGGIQTQIIVSAIQLLRPDLFVNFYSMISYFVAYFMILAAIGLQIICFFKLKNIFDKKMKVMEAERLKKARIRNRRRTISMDNFLVVVPQPPPSVDDRWDEAKYAMFFDCFKETSKHSFFFGYWMTLYNVIYIILVLSLQNVPVLQCLSILILVILCILLTATIKPFKDKSVAFGFFFNFGSVLLLALMNLVLAIHTSVTGATSANDDVGNAIFYLILANSCVNMIVGFGGVIYKLFPYCKSVLKEGRCLQHRQYDSLKL